MTDDNRSDLPPAPHPATRPAGLAIRLAAGLLLLAALADLVTGPPGRTAGDRRESGSAAPPDPRPVRIGSADRLHRLFERLGYDLDAVADGTAPVPRLELAALPPDLAELNPVDRRKALFIRAVLPIVIRANDAVLAERAALQAMLARLAAGHAATPDQAGRFRREAARYGLPGIDADVEGVRRLLRRVDGVPPSLALAQAISESGWGTSRFARTGNALFGQWTWDDGAGIVPAARGSGRSHRVRAFTTLGDSVRAYLFNLNTHAAYAGFRHARAVARRDGGGLPAGADLARQLTRYSERGEAYVQEIVTLIRQNRLGRLDGASLAGTVRQALAAAPADGPADG